MNERVLLTGASSGIGLAVVRYLAGKGCRVVGTLRNTAVLPEIGPGLDNLSFIKMDVTSHESIRTGTAEAVKLLGGIDVLVNNAGISHLGPFEQTDFEEARLILETNFWGMVRVTGEITPLMRRAGSGLILSIGSMAGHMGIPFQSYYVASKWALLGFSESLRLELKPFGLRVVVIDPGDFKTGIGQNRRLHPAVAPPLPGLLQPGPPGGGKHGNGRTTGQDRPSGSPDHGPGPAQGQVPGGQGHDRFQPDAGLGRPGASGIGFYRVIMEFGTRWRNEMTENDLLAEVFASMPDRFRSGGARPDLKADIGFDPGRPLLDRQGERPEMPGDAFAGAGHRGPGQNHSRGMDRDILRGDRRHGLLSGTEAVGGRRFGPADRDLRPVRLPCQR